MWGANCNIVPFTTFKSGDQSKPKAEAVNSSCPQWRRATLQYICCDCSLINLLSTRGLAATWSVNCIFFFHYVFIISQCLRQNLSAGKLLYLVVIVINISPAPFLSPIVSVSHSLKALMLKPENQVCSDCPERQPRWASLIVPPPGAPAGSLPMGAFCCLECSGSHRRLGVHISFVRSVNLDQCKAF